MENKLLEQINALVKVDLPLVSNLSNAAAVLANYENINWCGFYLVEGDNLYLGPFQGEPACTVIPKGKGVCGKAFEEKKSVIVKNVKKFKGHIACSTMSRSEIVVPIISGGEVKAVIDIDAPVINRFDDKDREILEEIAGFLAKLFIEGKVKYNHKDEEKNNPEAAIEKLREDYDL
jgi:GAF domain-containing protein